MNFLKHYFYTFGLVFLVLMATGCKDQKENSNKEENMGTRSLGEKATIEADDFGTMPDGKKVDRYTLKNQSGMEVGIITYGGIIVSLKAPNNEGISEDIMLGLDSLSQYIQSNPYFGAIIGRYGNRIANAKFSLEGMEYTLAANNGVNHLHGGIKGFDKVLWDAFPEKERNGASLRLTYNSKDMEEGYPGNLSVSVTYTLKDDNSLDVHYEATTDKKTIVNLTQHSYFNLSGDFSKTVLDHELTLYSDAYLPVDRALIPTGEIAPVDGSPFDFREPKTIGRDIAQDHDQLKKGSGYDHCWVLNNPNSGIRLSARVRHPESGRIMEVFTDEPGVQLYTGNFLNGTLPAKGGGTYAQRTGFCLETQHYPDSPNQKKFPSVVLNPGEKYASNTSFKFSTEPK